MKHAEKWYQRRLAKYFTEHYGEYEDTATFWTDPFPNSWMFDITELGLRIELLCDDHGDVIELHYEKN